jgi:hypothetical protein
LDTRSDPGLFAQAPEQAQLRLGQHLDVSVGFIDS